MDFSKEMLSRIWIDCNERARSKFCNIALILRVGILNFLEEFLIRKKVVEAGF